MNRKLITGGTLKAASEEGVATAIFSRFGGPPDHDGDITEPGAFTTGAEVIVSPWNHSSFSGALPAGKGVIRVRGDRAEVEARFFMDTQAGRETWLTLRALGGSEWSYGFEIQDYEMGTWQGERVRVLKRLKVFEVSPVLRGAGRDTETLTVRSDPATREVFERSRRNVEDYRAREVLMRSAVVLIASGMEGR